MIAGAISVIVAPDRRAALGLFRAYFIEPLLFFLVLMKVVRSSRQAVLLLAGLGAGGIVVAVLNIAINPFRYSLLNVPYFLVCSLLTSTIITLLA